VKPNPITPKGTLTKMKDITFSVDGSLIEKAERVAQARGTSLNAAFQRWLEHYAGSGALIDRLMHSLPHVRSAGP
jgi:hypothetical protein